MMVFLGCSKSESLQQVGHWWQNAQVKTCIYSRACLRSFDIYADSPVLAVCSATVTENPVLQLVLLQSLCVMLWKRLNFEIEVFWAVSLKIGMSSWINPALHPNSGYSYAVHVLNWGGQGLALRFHWPDSLIQQKQSLLLAGWGELNSCCQLPKQYSWPN